MSASNTGFKAQLGRADAVGLSPPAQRLKRIRSGVNPYITGDPLASDSPLFFGRHQALQEPLSVRVKHCLRVHFMEIWYSGV